MKAVRRVLDATLGRWARHIAFILVRSFFGLFYNVSCANKHLLQDLPGGLILASHVSRLDGPMIAAILYSTRRVRPAVHYKEYFNPVQWLPMVIANAIPLSSPKSWPDERRAARKDRALRALRRIIGNGGFVLLFPAGQTKRQPREIIQPRFSGAYDTLKAVPDCAVVLLRIHGLSKFDAPKYDYFWSFLSIQQGRRHVSVTIELIEGGLDTDQSLAAFNADLEARMNAPPHWPLKSGIEPGPPDG
ncbi:MAG: 1-acyl-sn-glycerol-3-phosphate acyltransferase [Pseudomonadota bacterium]